MRLDTLQTPNKPHPDSRLIASKLAGLHPAQISRSIRLPLTGSLDLLREALSLLILDLTLGQTTNNSFPLGAQCSIIHTDLPWLRFSFIFSRAEEELLNAESIAAIFPACSTSLTLCLEKEKHFTDLVPSNTNLFYDPSHSCVQSSS